MVQRIVMGLLIVAVAVLGFASYAQHRRLARMDDALRALRARSAESRPLAISALRTSLARAAATDTPAPAPPRADTPPPKPRANISDEEFARVESAVLRLLETDHPELRDKLLSLVQEQQHTLQEQQRETRRERWAARREARLLELSDKAGITADQREAILTIMLSQRDQIEDLRREADSPEAIATVRERTARVREQSQELIRKQLRPDQYDAFREHFDSDDDDRAPARERGGQR